MRSALLLALVGASVIVCACSKPEADPAASRDAELLASPPQQAPSAWSRASAASAPSAPSSEASAGLAPVAAIDPDALGELLAAAPKQAPKATGDEGSSLVGTDTDEKEGTKRRKKEEPAPSATPEAGKPPQKPLVSIGTPTVQGNMASPSIERAARAQLYWPLVQRCRDKQGKILPPDAVLILFRIDEDGYIIASSISATPATLDLEDAAHCMRRELSAATFRAPSGARGMPIAITMTAPSVD